MMKLIRRALVKLFFDEDEITYQVKHAVAVLMEREGFMVITEGATFHTEFSLSDGKCKMVLDKKLSRVDNLLCELGIPWE